jgi:hypothetical protein
MILPGLLALMAASAVVLTVLAFRDRLGSNPVAALIRSPVPCLLSFVLLCAYLLTAFPIRHRIYFDEDAYANMALNIGKGLPGHTTQRLLPDKKFTALFKWPIGFPLYSLPFLAQLGPESGPAVANRVCGVLTVAVIMVLAAWLGEGYAAAVVAALLFALQPVCLAWYSSGSAEPLSALVCLASVGAAWLSANQTGTSYFPAVSMLTAGIALHVRLENALVLVPVILLLRCAPRPWPRLVTGCAGVLLAAAVIHAIRHATVLRQFYLLGQHDSFFSLAMLTGNLWSNLVFVARHGLSTGLLVALVLTVALVRRKRSVDASRLNWLLLLFPMLVSGLLLIYSVGQYDAPGGSRMLLLVAPLFSAVGGAEIARLARLHHGKQLFICVILLLAASARSWSATETYLTQQWSTIALEHDTLLLWAAHMPEHSLVVSRLPYFWENLGFYADLPGLAAPPESFSVPVFLYFGIASGPQDWPPGLIPQRRIVTEHGALCLFRLN